MTGRILTAAEIEALTGEVQEMDDLAATALAALSVAQRLHDGWTAATDEQNEFAGDLIERPLWYRFEDHADVWRHHFELMDPAEVAVLALLREPKP